MTDTSEALPVRKNWDARNSKAPIRSIHEYPLYTDAEMIPQGVPRVAADCPYHFLRMSTIGKPGYVRLGVILRIDIHLVPKWQDIKTNDSLYHGGELEDEIAALASLCFGVRMRAGGESRRFQFDDDHDPLGIPVAGNHRPIPTLDLNEDRLVLPDVAKNMESLDEEALERLEWLLDLSPEQTIALVRAACLYQDALWIAESEPALAWLMFVSALETAANQWQAEKKTPAERLTDSYPKLVEILKTAGGDDLIAKVANIIAPLCGSTKKFIDFVLHYLPPAPAKRPSESSQVPWDSNSMEKVLRIIYKYRSKALHGGIPFPAPMCEPPYKETWYIEGTMGVAATGAGGTWMAEDIPINLHTFHYITRNVLLGWWRAMAKRDVRRENSDRDFDALTK